MQPLQTAPTDLKPRRTRRRRRPRQKRAKDSETDKTKPVCEERCLSLQDLASEASALEKQLNELQAQLKSLQTDGADAKHSAKPLVTGQTAVTEEEMTFVRKSLEKIYKQLLLTDPLYGSHHRFEDRLWRNIFYARIEHIRSKLRQPEEYTKQRQRLARSLIRHIDTAARFYCDLNSMIKSTQHIDTKAAGISLFKQISETSPKEQVVVLLQSNYICMGDLARYRATQLSSQTDKNKAQESWNAAKVYYQKAIDVYRSNGKPFCQMALVYLSKGSAIDIVWCYSMSISMKIPSSVGRENLRSFYAKVRFSHQKDNEQLLRGHGAEHATKLISQFAESFLQVHRAAMYDQSGDSAAKLQTNLLEHAVTVTILAAGDVQNDELPKTLAQTMHVLKSTLTRVTTILITAVWDLGERAKEKTNITSRPQLQSAQMNLLTFAFQLMTNIHKTSVSALEELKEKRGESDTCYRQLELMVDNVVLPALSIWCTFLFNNLYVCEQYCAALGGVESRLVTRETGKMDLVKAMQSFLSFVISHPSFPDPVLHILPATFPMSEDLTLLGLVPLAQFHSTVDFFKEKTYENDSSIGARNQVRWSRVRDLFKKMADSPSIEFVQYNQAEQKYSITDENARRQQQYRFMKALAAQRLLEQVSSLEKDVNKMSLPSDGTATSGVEVLNKPDVYTVVVDVTVFLDGLSKVKKWASQTLNSKRRQQSSILEVIVPLEVIDELDWHKKGATPMNMQARESIRYLDQKLLENGKNLKTSIPTSSFLRTQKLDEQLGWDETEASWLGNTSSEDNLLASDNADDALSTGSESDRDLFQSRRRRVKVDDQIENDSVDDTDSMTEGDDLENDSSDTDHLSENDDDDELFVDIVPAAWADVPKTFRSMIRCMLYYQQNREHVVLVTNDEELAWWASMFGDTKSWQHLKVKTVSEWNKELLRKQWAHR